MGRGIRVQALQARANVRCARVRGEPLDDDADADPFAGPREIANVRKARFVLPDEDDRELGMNPPVAQRIRTPGEFHAQVGREAFAIENQGGHAVAVSSVERGAPTLTTSPAYRYALWLIVAIALGVTLLVFAPFFASRAGKTAGPASLAGQAAPVFALQDDRGEAVSLAQYHGRLVIMNLWASWCPPCRAEMPDLQRLAERYGGGGIAVIGVNEGESPERARAFAQALRIRFPIWIDGSERYGRTYAALGLPTTIVLDRRGVVVRGFDGALTFDQMRATVAPLLRAR
jgi:thiol-disulfide isomerase/thioredoxin